MRGHSIFHTRLLAAFAGAALVVAALAVTTWTLSQDTLQALLWVSRTREVIDHIAHAKADTLAIELHTQRYRLSGNKAELAERDAAIAARETALRGSRR
jgi:hypothetical protein